MLARSRMTLGVDIGTTGARACVVRDARFVVAAAAVSYEPDRPRPGWVEQDPMVWWEAFRAVTTEALGMAGARDVRALSLSSQSTALLPVDKQFKPLRKAILWQDTRCHPQVQEMEEQLGAEHVRQITGWRPSTFLVWPKALWFREHEPELFEKTFRLIQASTFILHRLCGATMVDRANTVGYPMDLRKHEWSMELARWHEFPIEKLPRVAPSDAQVGRVSRPASAATGLRAETPIIAGGMDSACAAFAVGAYKEGRAFEVTGTSGGIGVISDRPSANPALGVAPHLLEHVYINHAPMSAGGASLSWMKDELCWSEEIEAAADGVDVYDVMEREVAALEDGPTGLVFLPYLAGERAPVWDPATRGAFLGLELSTTRPQMIKAVMEGVAYALRQNISIVESGKVEVEALRSCGGGTKSETWCQIKADVTGKAIVVFPEERDAAFGAALLAGLTAKVWKMEEIESAVENEEVVIFAPRPEVSKLYAPYQKAYEKSYPHLREVLAW